MYNLPPLSFCSSSLRLYLTNRSRVTILQQSKYTNLGNHVHGKNCRENTN